NRYLPPQLFQKLRAEPVPDFAKLPPELKPVARAGFEKRKQFVGMCAQAGVSIIAGTDGAALGALVPGFGQQRELQLLVQAGLTSLQALRAATINAARALGEPLQAGQFVKACSPKTQLAKASYRLSPFRIAHHVLL